MKKLMGALIYIVCFFVLFTVIYRLAFCEPVLPREKGYAAFSNQFFGRMNEAAAVISGLAVGSAAGMEFMCRKYFKLKAEMKKKMDMKKSLEERKKSGSDD